LEGLDIIEFGNEMEGVLARFYERKHKLKLYQPETLVHPEFEFIAGNVDRRIKDNPSIAIECKNTGLFVNEGWGEPGTDQVPERVILQCTHYMMLDPEIQQFHVLRCYGGNQYQEFVVPRNQQLIEALLAIEVGFYNNVKAGVLPDPDWMHRTTGEAMRRAFHRIEGTVQAMPELEHWTKAHIEAQEELKRVSTLASSVKNHIAHLMGNVEIALLPDGTKWRRKMIKRAGYTVEPAEYIETRLIRPRKKGDDDE
jgi:predicted phage-related endonuclease